MRDGRAFKVFIDALSLYSGEARKHLRNLLARTFGTVRGDRDESSGSVWWIRNAAQRGN